MKPYWVITLLALMPMTFAMGNDRGVSVDMIIAVVGGEPITESELRQEARIALALREGEAAALTHLDDDALGAFRDYVVNQMVVSVHVRRLGTVELARVKVDVALQKFKARFRSPSSYEAFRRRFDIGEEKIRSILRRELRNQMFVKERLRSRQLSNRRGADNLAWSEDAISTLLAEKKQTVEIRYLGPDHQLELQ